VTRPSIAAIALALAGIGGGIFAAPAHAQMDSSAPVVTRTKTAKPVWLKAEVITADRQKIVVREADHPMVVHTFSYSEKAAQQFENAMAAGGYQHGDAVKIRYQPSGTVALSIKGKPSKSP
jgi:hypothetical protein